MKNTLGWINGKLDCAEERICGLKHVKELTKIKHTEKNKRETKKSMSCRTSPSFLIYGQMEF